MQCAAVTKACRKCRGYGVEIYKGVYLCHIHADFYEECDTALQMVRRYSSIFQTAAQRNATRDMLKVADYVHGGIFGQIGLDMIADLWGGARGERWSQRDKADHIYQQFVEAGVLDPLDHMDLWIRGLTRQTRTLLHTFMNRQHDSPFVRRSIADMLVGPYLRGVAIEVALVGLLGTLRRPVFNFTATVPLERQLTLVQWFLEYAFSLTDNHALIGLSIESDVGDEAAQQSLTSLLHNPQLQDWIRTMLRSLTHAERLKRRRQMNRLREEMMAAAWHPRRVAGWLEAGLEIEDL